VSRPERRSITHQRRIPMVRYVDGYVLPVPKKRVEAYRRMAQKAGQVWRDHGALEYRECVGDDLRDPRLADMMDPKAMPFDTKRMVYGGFKVLVDV
jgi:uncharacterized protein YbaA (DUF1428 family)